MLRLLIRVGLVAHVLLGSLWAVPEVLEQGCTLWWDEEDRAQQAAYALGHHLGERLKALNTPILADEAVLLGVRDALSETQRLPDDVLHHHTHTFQALWRDQHQKTLEQQRLAHQQAGEAFYQKAVNDPSYRCLANQLCWQVQRDNPQGGRSPTFDDEVTLHYRVFHLDGQLIDSSHERGAPLRLHVQNTLPGWMAILPYMRVGDVWSVNIPPELAFGTAGHPPHVGPDEWLRYELALLAVH